MAADTRARMIQGAVRTLAVGGMAHTSFSEVLELTGASRGSIYHHFPGGKDELVAQAVDTAGAQALAFLDTLGGQSAPEVTAAFLDLWRQLLVTARFTAGCSVLAVVTATQSAGLLEHGAEVFRRWHSALAALLTDGGLDDGAAQRFASLLIASAEGGVAMSRAEQSLQPFDDVTAELLARVASLTAGD